MRYIYPALRMFIGLIFVVSGSEKLLQHYENFLYVIQGYDILPWLWAQRLVAHLFPWVELMLGVFLILGLWLKQALYGVWLCFFMFIFLLGQAQVRMLPISDCGCFGDLIKFPLNVTMSFDSVLFLITSILLFSLPKTRVLSLDSHFLSNS